MYDECAPHPWFMQDMICHLAWWDDKDYGSYLPDVRVRADGTKPALNSRLFFDTRKRLTDFLADNPEKTFMVVALSHFDKYGGICKYAFPGNLATSGDGYDGAIFLDLEEFEQKCLDDNGRAKPQPERFGLARQALDHEFEELYAWSYGNIFGCVCETKCKCCGSWIPCEDGAVWGFSCLKGNVYDMILAMAEHWPFDEEVRKILIDQAVKSD